MREPYSASAEKNLRPRFTSYRFISTIDSLLSLYKEHPKLSLKSAQIRARLVGYHSIYSQISLKPVREALVQHPEDFTPLSEITDEKIDVLNPDQASVHSLSAILKQDFLKPWLDLKLEEGQDVKLLLVENSYPSFEKRLVVFKSDLVDEGYSRSASAGVEPITQTLLIRITQSNNHSVLRDSLSIVIDLVMQNRYLNAFFGTDGPIDMPAVRSDMLITGIRVAVHAYHFILSQSKSVKANIYRDALVLSVSTDYYQTAHYLRYIVEQLILVPIDIVLKLAASSRMTEYRDLLIKQYHDFYSLRRCRILVQAE